MTLSDVQLQNIHQELQAQLVWRTSQLDELKAQVEYEGADRQTALTDLAATDRVIAEIGQSLERLADGTYGVCLDCGVQVPFDRLKIRPLARFCMTCQLRNEMR